MNIPEEVVLLLAEERLRDALRAADQTRAIRSARTHRSVRVRLGSLLVRLGRWVLDQPSPAHS